MANHVSLGKAQVLEIYIGFERCFFVCTAASVTWYFFLLFSFLFLPPLVELHYLLLTTTTLFENKQEPLASSQHRLNGRNLYRFFKNKIKRIVVKSTPQPGMLYYADPMAKMLISLPASFFVSLQRRRHLQLLRWPSLIINNRLSLIYNSAGFPHLVRQTKQSYFGGWCKSLKTKTPSILFLFVLPLSLSLSGLCCLIHNKG